MPPVLALAATPAMLSSGAALGASALGGALSGRASARTQNQASKTTGTVTPIESPEFAGLQNALMDMAMKRLGGDTDLSGYETSGISNINQAFDAERMARDNALAARGLSTSPIAGNADIIAGNERAGDIASFRNTLPIMQREFQNQDFSNALNLFARRPVGEKRTGTSTGNVVFPGSGGADAFGSLGSMLGFLIGQGKFGG